ncbi:hypothetical protein B0A49_02525 [Cryomyces minteri]|uniref:Uncharacterized protein n=1 Tax=Cryomyces minteri TaxID=331657 RepID=A0A4U0XN24_9PEZI|nr:hypothetical protein B0A49_02525 [Cryomyces minteri]
MAPLRRYLRISRYSVLEVRIYLDNPSLTQTWLLNPRASVLPSVIQAVRPLVLPKLREENERAQGKGKGKKRGVRDVVATEEFEVSIFLTELSSRHCLLTKQKVFRDKPPLKSNAGKLTGWLGGESHEKAILVEEEEAPLDLDDIPEAIAGETGESGKKRAREDDGEALFVNSSSDSGNDFQTQRPSVAVSKRRKRDAATGKDEVGTEDDKKKLALNTSYDGFSIYGRILCLVVKKKGGKGKAVGAGSAVGGSEMLENWVSTQAVRDAEEAEDELLMM